MSTGLPGELTALLDAAAYPHAVGMVRVVETHLSWVFLTGELAYKVKKPVCFAFVDLRSVERRAFFCAEELRLNRRFAPELYLKVCRVTLAGGRARIEGRGKLIDHAVCMRQFRAEDELGALLANGSLAAREREAADASEADSSVLALQETRFEPVCAAEQLRVIDVDTTRADAVAQVLERLLQADGAPRHNS